jgi:hypothetical protein
MTPGLNLSRYERPLAERRLPGGAVPDRVGVGGLPPGPSSAPEKHLIGCGMMEVSLAET